MSNKKDKSYKNIQSKKQKLNGAQKWEIKRKEKCDGIILLQLSMVLENILQQ
jgi:hypothetical protein